MDKFKSVIDYVKKFGFWFLLGLTVLVVLGCWWWATSSVAKEVKDMRGKIDKSFKEVQAIADTSQHPNQKYLEALDAEEKKLKEKVLAAWKSLYEEQQKKNPWPEVLGKEFLDMIKDLKPKEEIPYTYRNRYLNFIQDYFPTLLKEVNWRHPKEDAANLAPGPNGEQQVEMEGIVDWDANDIKRLKDKFNWQETPSDLKVKLAQEDIWVALSLLRVIRNTNGDITEHSKAAIKHIDALDIGANAVQAWRAAEGQVFRGGAAAAPASGEPVAPAASGPAAGGTATGEREMLLHDRYVDDKGNPLSADAAPPYPEFKMMPIRMRLYIDQRKIAKLLVECANSAMPIEVRRVRIKPGEGQVVDLGGNGMGGASSGGPMGAAGLGMPSGYGPGMSSGYGVPGPPPGYGRGMMPPGYGPGMRGAPPPGYGRPMGGLTGPSSSPMPGGTVPWDKSLMDIPIEIQGIICIYNPPDKDKLGTGAAGGMAPPESATPPAESPETSPATPPRTPVRHRQQRRHRPQRRRLPCPRILRLPRPLRRRLNRPKDSFQRSIPLRQQGIEGEKALFNRKDL